MTILITMAMAPNVYMPLLKPNYLSESPMGDPRVCRSPSAVMLSSILISLACTMVYMEKGSQVALLALVKKPALG